MKILIGALALVIAAPAAAQTAPADPHAGHAQHQQGQQKQGQPHQGHSGHGQPADHSRHMDCCKDGKCCDTANAGGKTMACCAKKGGDAAAHKGHGA